MTAESTVLERGDQVRAGERMGLVLEVGTDAHWTVIQWAPYDEIPDGEYESELYEVPDMHHSSLPHLEVLRDDRWQRVSDLDFWADRERERDEPPPLEVAQ